MREFSRITPHVSRTMAEHEALIKEALALAKRGLGWVSPNPMVGAVVVKDGEIVGRGWHQEFGGPHAEVFALREAGEKARGATLYCTLEPCNHHGKTPPCTQAVIDAGIARVVLGARDPNKVASGGVDKLRAAGIEVITGIGENECRKLNAAFFKTVSTGVPLVSLKWAMSADGKIATSTGDSKWITGEEARTYAHQLRAEHDAVLIGIGTALADNARLNCRIDSSERKIRQPRRVVLDAELRLPVDASILGKDGGATIVFCKSNASTQKEAALRGAGAEVIRVNTANAKLDLGAVLKVLSSLGVQSVLVEGGSRVLGSFADQKLADMAYVFIAPKIIGGDESLTAIGGAGVQNVQFARPIQSPCVRILGNDVLLAGALSEWERIL